MLNGEDAEKVQVLLLCVGFAKLILVSMISDNQVCSPRRGSVGVLTHAQVLKSLVVAYLSPDMAENQML
jgi:condensin complex subunit 3